MAKINLSDGEVDILDVLASKEDYYQGVYNTGSRIERGLDALMPPVGMVLEPG